MRKFEKSYKGAILLVSLLIFIFITVQITLLLQLNKYSTVDSNQNYDYVLILGSGLNNNQIGNTLKSRLDKSLEYINSNKKAKIIVSGGITGSNTITEAEAMYEYLKDRNVDTMRIIKEDKSTSTFENIKFSTEILKNNNDIDKKILIITSDFHLPRALLISKNFNLNTEGLSSKTNKEDLPRFLSREFPRVIADTIRSLPLIQKYF